MPKYQRDTAECLLMNPLTSLSAALPSNESFIKLFSPRNFATFVASSGFHRPARLPRSSVGCRGLKAEYSLFNEKSYFFVISRNDRYVSCPGDDCTALPAEADVHARTWKPGEKSGWYAWKVCLLGLS